MPQKKNPDIAELVRGKTGRVYGALTSMLTTMKGIPLAYNKDMQEDKEAIFDSFDTVKMALRVFSPMLDTMRVNKERMRKAALEGFINATDCADYLVGKGLPFRSAYKAVGALVAYCIDNGKTLESADLSDYKRFSELFDTDVYAAIDLDACVERRACFGATSPKQVLRQIEAVSEQLKNA